MMLAAATQTRLGLEAIGANPIAVALFALGVVGAIAIADCAIGE